MCHDFSLNQILTQVSSKTWSSIRRLLVHGSRRPDHGPYGQRAFIETTDAWGAILERDQLVALGWLFELPC